MPNPETSYVPALSRELEEFHLLKQLLRYRFWKVEWFGTFEAVSCRVLLSSIVSTSLQEGQWKTSSSGSTPSFGIVRTSSIASPQERHANVGGLSGTIGGERSITGVEGV